MTTAGRCKICADPRIESIDDGLRNGEPAASIGRAFGYSSQLMALHWRRCRRRGYAAEKPKHPELVRNEAARVLADKPPAASEPASEPAPDPRELAMPKPPEPSGPDDPNAPILDALKELRAIHGAALKKYAQAAKLDTGGREMTVALPALRKNIELRVDLEARLVKPKTPEESLRDHPDWLRSVIEGARALDSWPEARAAFIASQEAIVGPLEEKLSK